MKRFALPIMSAAALSVIVVCTVAQVDFASAQSPTATTPEESKAYLHSYNLPSSGIALEGYCPVAYFAVNRPVKGKPEHASTHNGVTYHFVSADAQRAFEKDPEQYLPAYGGWCALGMAVEDKFPVDPRSFKIVDGRLLLFLKNRNVDALKLWNDGDEKAQLRKADSHWNKVRN